MPRYYVYVRTRTSNPFTFDAVPPSKENPRFWQEIIALIRYFEMEIETEIEEKERVIIAIALAMAKARLSAFWE
ncbi:hypothetical protein MW887_010609 [Aspergillus wentii]|nr:hypothetical protein MW887_010609 [Aspergillus wentii]